MDLNFKKIIAWLKRNKIDYTVKDNRIVLFHDANGCVEFVFNSGRNTYKAPRGCLMASSAADGSDFYVKIGDWGKWINEFLDWAKDRDYYEYNHYHCAQWGTWKFGNFISMSFFGVFIKKILALKNGVNESMQLAEAKKILNKNGFMLKERFVNINEIHVPEWLWVAYETGDTSNLEDEEIAILHNFEKKHKNHILEPNAEPSFLPTNDVTDEGDMCYTVEIFEDRLVEGYDSYRNRFNQMNRKRQEEKKQELIRMRASFCDNPDRAKVGILTSPYNGEAVYGKQMWDDGVPVMKYWYRDNKTISVTLKNGTPCIVLLDKYGEDAQDVWIKYRSGWLRIDGDSIEVEF